MKKILIIALIPFLLIGCKKRDLQIERLVINSESIEKSTTSIQVTVDYTYISVLKGAVGYVSQNSDMSNAISANASVSEKQFVVSFDNLAYNTKYYYYFECDNGVDIIKTEVKYATTDFPGLIKSKYSVSDIKKVYFSQANLQYQASTNTWRFADNQFVIVGSNNSNISPTYDGWIDLFGWGTGDNPTNSSIENNDYITFVDWGSNAISNGGNASNLWRTMTNTEWDYLFNERNTPSGIRFAQAEVNGTLGVILLPDNWNSNLFALNNVNIGAEYDSNIITLSDWTDIFETNGAVFLPAGGRREGTVVDLPGMRGSYWSSTNYHGVGAYNVYFFGGYIYNPTTIGTYMGNSVRLVSDVE